MNAYRAVIAGMTLAAIALAASLFLLRDTDYPAVFSAVVTLEAIADVIATLYILGIVVGDKRRPRSWLLLFLVTGAALVTLGLLPIAAIVVLRLLGEPPLPNGLGVILVGAGLCLIGAVPIMKAALFLLVQHDATADPPEAVS